MTSYEINPKDSNEVQPSRLRFQPTRIINDHMNVLSTLTTHHFHKHLSTLRNLKFHSFPWFGWCVIHAFLQFYFLFSRGLALKALIFMYGTSGDNIIETKIKVLSLGFLEDFVCITYFMTALWIFDTWKRIILERYNEIQQMMKIATFLISWLLFLLILAPFVADMMLVVHRNMRFSFGLFASVVREREYLKDAPISNEEIEAANMTGGHVILIATLFALVRVRTTWTNLAYWDPFQITFGTHNTIDLTLEEGSKSTNSTTIHVQSTCRRITLVILVLIAVPALVVTIRSFCSPLVAYAALNVTLNELLYHKLEPSLTIEESMHFRIQPWVERFIDPSEDHERFGHNTLYRRTTGFHGNLAFNVTIDQENPPNVLVIGVESFRYRDSRYLVGQEDPSNLFKGTNLTITPQFDRWAQRGVAFRNIWSSIPTSRSLESLIFAQVPYHSSTQTGITGGREDVKLSGLPQLFLQKGYETYFTTGSTIELDAWDRFLPSHGYSTVWNKESMMEIAEKTLNFTKDDWTGHQRRAGGWGVHDDVTFQILGNLLVEKKNAQENQMMQGQKKVPTFITHYTISSHEPYHALPGWYERGPQPDFSVMYKDEKFASQIEHYMKLRYFSDSELGKFMDRMEREGILNDTIVVIVGDHGQAPEVKVWNYDEVSSTRVPAAIIAEGRLGDAVGLVIDDAAEHYDLLNTLADITGLPEGGFVQNGVGRSLKRKLPFGERVVFANDPLRKMAIVRGHERLRYDLVTDAMMLHDTELDYHMSQDLLPLIKENERAEWKALREEGRRIASYYIKRWDENCLLAVECEG
ncbi:sulfatase-like protein [Plasmopara halstedii]|uniref:Sulfatase-like protein n=1 Tax=Plasmopara halstedii TaxID=4781 RepID=A0A0N7L6K8_PLAHL|nr:sulfatase-like protein [Plasmopara halstedii]CEG44555.1 sulfatase-like protein [Plasmopara halstedii]|eukprot:XP_024580924.1 sulfatase-like protein [Plasmopara halstedii]